MVDDDKEVNVVDESTDEVVPYKYSITSYGADYPVDAIINRMEKDIIFIPPFQRSYVWSKKQASRFIESLLLGLPVPGIFLSKEADTGRLLVIDGQQRLRSLQFFYNGLFARQEFTLENVQPRFEGKTYKTLVEEDKIRLDDSIIHATVVRQDEPSDDESSIYHIFERLNTGGNQLQPQEIRACIFHGNFNELLKDLNTYKAWRNVYGPVSKRLKDQELILRFFALYYFLPEYKRPMKEFLNEYMGKNRKLKFQNGDELKNTFYTAIDLIAQALGKKAFRLERAINAAVFDAIIVGLAKRLNEGPITQIHFFEKEYNILLQNDKFVNACRTGTSDEINVTTRIDLATEAFANLS